MDAQGVITVWNRAAEDMKGCTAQEAIGHPLAMLYTDEQKAQDWPEHNLSEARKTGFYKEETWRRCKDGSLFWTRIALTALRDHSGVLVGFSKVSVDLTAHKRLESCVREQADTERILRTANAGMWTWHPDTDQMDVCANFLGLLGHPDSGTSMTFGEWLGFVDPSDRSRVAEKFLASRAEGTGAPLVMETRMCKKDGRCRWFYVHADWHRDNEADPYVMNGVNVDIHDLKTVGEGLRLARPARCRNQPA